MCKMVTMSPPRDADSLVGVAEIADVFDVPRSTASMWGKRRASSGFPEPVAELRAGPVYRLGDVSAWVEARGDYAI